MAKNTACNYGMPIAVQAGLRVRELALHSNRTYLLLRFLLQGGAYEHQPACLTRDETITPRVELIKYIPVFHPSGFALRSKSVPEGFAKKGFSEGVEKPCVLPTELKALSFW